MQDGNIRWRDRRKTGDQTEDGGVTWTAQRLKESADWIDAEMEKRIQLGPHPKRPTHYRIRFHGAGPNRFWRVTWRGT
jgi:hypothetical protein